MINPNIAQSYVKGLTQNGWLALFTSMPSLAFTNSSWTATWVEVPFDDSSASRKSIGYARVNLNGTGAYGSSIMPSNATTNSSAGTSEFGVITDIKNQDMITFPMCLNAEGWGNIVGYGIFTGSSTTSFENLKYWGEFESAQTISQSTVAVITPSQLTITLNGNASASASN